jgi:uncharacterized membrane protein
MALIEEFEEEGIWLFRYRSLLPIIISLIGLGIRIYTVGHTPKNTSGRNTKEQIAETLNTSGIYSIVRHPLYLGNFFMWFGLAMLTGNVWFILVFCLVYWLYYERIMFAEEQFLRRKFGEQYLNWAKKVPAFIPKYSKFFKSDLTFSWKKVLKQEKNGLAAIFLLFCVFDIAGELIEKDTHFNYFLIAGTILTLLMYVVLKYIKKRTQILNESGR